MGGGDAAPLPKTPAVEAVSAAVEEIGFGPYQLMTLAMTGGIMFAEGAEMLVMGSITSLLHHSWDLAPAIRGAMVSIVFVGFSIGNLLSGQVGDRFGRRTGILLSYTMIACFGFATACATGPKMMIALRFFVGMGCGVGFPAVYTLMPEVCPAKWRGAVSTLMIGFMPLGELFAALWVLLVDPELDNSAKGCDFNMYYPTKTLQDPDRCTWKTLCELSAIPAFCFLMMATNFLYESPQLLASQGRFDELEKVMKKMCQMNGVELDMEAFRKKLTATSSEVDAPVAEIETKGYSFGSAVQTMAQPSLRYVVLFMCFAHMTKDFSVFGLAYVLPQYFVFLKGMVAGLELLIVASISLPGVLLAFLATRVQSIPRSTWMSISAGLCGFFAGGMLEAGPDVLAAPCAYLVKLLALCYFIFTVVFTAEAFPTSIRNTAVGCCTAAGRMGSIGAPLIFEVSKHAFKSFDFFVCCLITSMLTIASLAPFCLPKKSAMDTDSAEADEAKALEVDSEAAGYGSAAKA
eukprot:TRINITY_DN24383_c0_g1_i1.p1 TRINITY_DN24383_c0_g1~~TRINITY_DN24383_c0_g1_i1.p1  ORF type:complete len:518 (-),score=107.26 TRINITY_DN24383_c0_g1_i1:74-1627(-)